MSVGGNLRLGLLLGERPSVVVAFPASLSVIVENDQIAGRIFRKFSGDVLREVGSSLSGLHAYTVDIAVVNDISDHVVEIVTAALVLDRAKASCTNVNARPAKNVVEDVHVDGIEI